MRRSAILLPLLLSATPALAQDAAVEAPIHAFADRFNKGDVAGARATMAADLTITDEFAPFLWEGKDAFTRWIAGYDADAKARGITGPAVAVGAATRTVVTGNRAYVVAPATYTFKQKGVAMSEVAQMTFRLDKGTTGWKIRAWTWTGPEPVPVQ